MGSTDAKLLQNLHAGRPVVRLALGLVNDSLLQTSMSARRHPADVAAGDSVCTAAAHVVAVVQVTHCVVFWSSRCMMTVPVHAGAAGALQLGASLLGVQLHGGSAGSSADEGATDHDIDWRRLVGLVPREVDAAGVELLEALSDAVAGSACSAATVHNADAVQPA